MVGVLLRVMLITAAAELMIMLAMDSFENWHPLTAAMVDTVALALITGPILYLWVIRPYVAARDSALAEVAHLAFHDPLTQLPNRRLLREYLDKALATHRRHEVGAAILMIDLDGFKNINDSYGHAAGDAVLIEIATRIREVIRAEDVAARMGGDEFLVLLNQLDADEEIAHTIALQLAERIHSEIERAIPCQNQTLRVGASIGVRLLTLDVADADTLLTDADKALYAAKSTGRGRIVEYLPAELEATAS